MTRNKLTLTFVPLIAHAYISNDVPNGKNSLRFISAEDSCFLVSSVAGAGAVVDMINFLSVRVGV